MTFNPLNGAHEGEPGSAAAILCSIHSVLQRLSVRVHMRQLSAPFGYPRNVNAKLTTDARMNFTLQLISAKLSVSQMISKECSTSIATKQLISF